MDEMTAYEALSNYEAEVDQAIHFGDEPWMAELVSRSDEIYEIVDIEMPGEGEDFRNRIADCLVKLEEGIEQCVED